ncbi:MAG: YcgN family cysteine cluster protein [Methylocystis sp.]
MVADSKRFWEKPLASLTPSEWERLCDGCGRCCLVKLEDEDSGEIHHTGVACRLLDHHSCRCSRYRGRKRLVPECVRLTPARLAGISWLPPSCSYRLRLEGKPLPSWHHLLTGDPESIHNVGMSVRGRVEASEQETEVDELPRFIRRWPKSWPKRSR